MSAILEPDAILTPIARLALPDGDAMTNRAQRDLDYIAALQIDSAETYDAAAEEAKAINKRIKELEDQKKALVAPFTAGLTAVRALFDGPVRLLDMAKTTLAGKMLDYRREQERIAKAEQARRDALIAQERAEREAAARKAAEESEAKQAEAMRLADAGDIASAEQAIVQAEAMAAQATAIATEAAVITAPRVAPAVAKVTGVSTAKTVDFEVSDKLALLEHIVHQARNSIAAGMDPLDLVDVNNKHLRALVRISGVNTRIPGVRVFEVESMRFARS